MQIIVCIKQVPDTTEVKIDPETGRLIREGVPSIVNPFDKHAVEAALQLREAHGGKVTVITMGLPQAQEALRECLAMGADEAILVSDRPFGGADTLATSYTLSRACEKVGDFDMILFGKQAIDGDTAQVGPGVAEHLNLPQVTYVQKILKVEEGKIQVERGIEGGYEVIEVNFPCVLTVDKSINEPRFPTMMGTMKAHKKEIPVWGVQDIDADETKIGVDGSATWVKRTFAPERKGRGEIIEAETPDEAVAILIGKLRDAKVV